MPKSTPSLLALLGLVAVAGYQNRRKISEMLADARNEMPGSGQGQVADSGGLMANISQMLQSATGGSTLSGGLSELVERFKAAGKRASVESWVADGPNMAMDVEDLERALGSATLDDLSQKTGLPRAQLLLRLNAALPEVVNRLTPNGRKPTVAEAHLWLKVGCFHCRQRPAKRKPLVFDEFVLGSGARTIVRLFAPLNPDEVCV